MLSVSGLHLWRGDRHVLRGVNFSAAPGQCVLLTGKNGAGKTTLLRAIAGLLDPEEGQISGAMRRRVARAMSSMPNLPTSGTSHR
jgi:ABC-type branched-subunit amino acid transport system ATPase component